ncbi:synaptotagmin-12 [Eurytemora carolleeae]|uniref:synaptotagmin-12 n=1 Tax=Eurytemora carolleeae TaxID=1294199 RepID=UPI000C7801C6|nr:synaptotagmin-12 [Eurytemora carolleeae]|eukprot:XP_023337857.1 synaptotagmin-12-like [Eurytemora affinis]
MDQDRHTGPTELGRATVSLKEAKQTVQDPERSTLTLFLTQQKKENGEIQFGLSYLPTAQRLSINLGKASNLRFDKEDQQNNSKKPNPYVKLFFFNQSGRLVKKKKSAIKYDTKEPFFDETIHFEAEPAQLENHTVLVVLLSKHEQEEDLDDVGEGMIGLDLDSSDAESYYRFNLSSADRGRKASSSGKQKDSVLGVLCLGKHVRGDKEREQWNKMMDSPRKVFTILHSLK